MPPDLLESQFADLEEPQNAIVLNVALSIDEMIAEFKQAIPFRQT